MWLPITGLEAALRGWNCAIGRRFAPLFYVGAGSSDPLKFQVKGWPTRPWPPADSAIRLKQREIVRPSESIGTRGQRAKTMGSQDDGARKRRNKEAKQRGKTKSNRAIRAKQARMIGWQGRLVSARVAPREETGHFLIMASS